MKAIVTPLYYINDALAKELNNGDLIVITDDVSPVFPLERRMEWLAKTVQDKKFIIDSIVQNDESEEFLGAVKDKLTKTLGDVSYELIMFVTDLAHDNVKELDAKFIKLKNPLELKNKDLNSKFKIRFGSEFDKYIKPKQKALPNKEEHYMLPVITLREEEAITARYFGVIDNYITGNLELLSFESDYMASVATMNTITKLWIDKFFGAIPLSKTILGSVNGKTLWAFEIEMPNNINLNEENGNRIPYSDGVDIVYIKDDYFKLAEPLFSWAYLALEASEVADEAPQE